MPSPYSPASRPEGLLVCVDFTDLSGGQFSPPHKRGFVLCESLPDRHVPTVDFHKGVVQVAVASYPVKHRLHLPPHLDVLFPALEDFRVRKFSQFLTSAPGMTEETLNWPPPRRPPSGRKCYRREDCE